MFKVFSYLVIAISIIVDLALSILLLDLVRALQMRKQVKFYWVHLL